MRGDRSVNKRLFAVGEARSTAKLIAALDDPSPEVAKAAAARLVEVAGSEATGELRARMLDADFALVGTIAAALRRLHDDAAVDVAIAGLREARYPRRLAAARALRVFSDPRAASALRAVLRDPIAGVRAAALDALANLGQSEMAASECAPLLLDPAPHVRLRAVNALAWIARRPGRFLATAAHDSDAQVRIEVARHLASLPDSAGALLLSDRDWQVREAAACGAGIGQLDALVALLGQDPNPYIRLAAAQTLGELGEPRAVPRLLCALEDSDPTVRAAALRALARLVTPAGAMEWLQSELHSPSGTRRRAVVYALARMTRTEGEPAHTFEADLARMVEDPDPNVRVALVHTAVELHANPRPIIEYLAGDHNETVRHAAEMWLARSNPARR